MPPPPPAAPGPAEPAPGWLAREVEQEFPDLCLLVAEVHHTRREPLTASSPPDIETRMREMSNRFRGGRAVGVRREPITAAYRIFFRQIGMDPDVQRTPIEAAIMERMLRGGFPTGGLIEDVLLIALLETGVLVGALDAHSLDGPLGIRTSTEGETLGRGRGGLGRSPGPTLLPAGRLVVADAAGAVAVLFGEVAPAHRPGPQSTRVALFAVRVGGVPALYAEEALWSAEAALRTPARA